MSGASEDMTRMRGDFQLSQRKTTGNFRFSRIMCSVQSFSGDSKKSPKGDLGDHFFMKKGTKGGPKYGQKGDFLTQRKKYTLIF